MKHRRRLAFLNSSQSIRFVCNSRWSLFLLTSLLALLLASCSGGPSSSSGSGTGTGPGTTPGPQVTLQSSTASITAGQSATLTWTSANATTVAIMPSVSSSPLPLNGAASVTPRKPRLTPLQRRPPTERPRPRTTTITVYAAPLPPTVTISVNPTTINSGQTASVTWTSTNATSVVITPNILSDELPTYPLNGSQAVNAGDDDDLRDHGDGRGRIDSDRIDDGDGEPGAADGAVDAFADQHMAGHHSTLSWSTNNAATLTIMGSDGTTFTSRRPAQGSAAVMPAATTTYTATATSPAGLVGPRPRP